MTVASFDPQLLGRYEGSGPRYTSYPTVPWFREDFDEAAFRRCATRSNEALIPNALSLYLHVPFCTSPCFYCGCNRVITRDRARGERYLERLLREISAVAPLFDRDRDVVQMHLGGGTPNFLEPAQLGRLVESLDRHFHFSRSPDRDFSIELDPRHCDSGDIEALAALGINRASLGVQDFDPAVQRAVNRIQGEKDTLELITACREAGMRSVNVDLIYGLPKQTLAGFAATLEAVVEARPHRVAVYGYAHLPARFKAQRQIPEEDLPDAAARLGLIDLAVRCLTSAGYEHIGMDHFALPEDDLARAAAAGGLHRNFMGYTTHAGCDLIGLGVSAISQFGDSYSQNHRLLPDWEKAIDANRLPVWRGLRLGFDELLRADVIQQVMCRAEVDMEETSRRYGIEFREYFSAAWPRLALLATDGILEFCKDRIVITSRGRYLLRIIAMCFDRHLQTTESFPSAAGSTVV